MDQLSQGFIITIIATLFLSLIAVGIIILVLLYQKRQVRFQKEKERQILESKIEAQEQTLKKVSEEIHDNIGQVLTLVKINLTTINLSIPDAAKEKLDSTKVLVTKAIQDLRGLSQLLSSDYINEVGLEEAIKQQLTLLQETGCYQTELFINGTSRELPSHVKIEIFRVIQELLTNIVKHAAGSEIKITIDHQPEKLIITVEDNGKGLNLEKHQARHNGLGLRNISNRMKLINGVVSFDSQPGKGTRVKLEL